MAGENAPSLQFALCAVNLERAGRRGTTRRRKSNWPWYRLEFPARPPFASPVGLEARELGTCWWWTKLSHLVWPGNPSANHTNRGPGNAHSERVVLEQRLPEQLGQGQHFAGCALLDGDRFHDLQAFRDETASYRPVGRRTVQSLLE